MVPNPGASTPRRHCKCGRFIPALPPTMAELRAQERHIHYAVAEKIAEFHRAGYPMSKLRNCDLALIVHLTLVCVHSALRMAQDDAEVKEVAA